jgi:hypothetical protein
MDEIFERLSTLSKVVTEADPALFLEIKDELPQLRVEAGGISRQIAV